MFIKRQMKELRFMTQHSVHSTGTASTILMSPDLPVFRAKVWLARLTHIHRSMHANAYTFDTLINDTCVHAQISRELEMVLSMDDVSYVQKSQVHLFAYHNYYTAIH